MNSNKSVWPVMVLAHNEEAVIADCLDSLFAAEPSANLAIYVMANGCTDRTEDVVREYGASHPNVHVVSIELGDKCNAWNVFIHDWESIGIPPSDVYFFMDGDAKACPNSLSVLAAALRDHPEANASSAPPSSGRTMAKDRRELIEQHALVANLYALSGRFVEKLRASRARLPLGLEGDDGLIGALAKWDADPQSTPWDDKRVFVCENAGFTFESLDWRKLHDWKVYWKRIRRYSRRSYENQLLGPLLKEHGVSAMPRHITELYKDADRCKFKWAGIYTPFSWLTLRSMRRHVAR